MCWATKPQGPNALWIQKRKAEWRRYACEVEAYNVVQCKILEHNAM